MLQFLTPTIFLQWKCFDGDHQRGQWECQNFPFSLGNTCLRFWHRLYPKCLDLEQPQCELGVSDGLVLMVTPKEGLGNWKRSTKGAKEAQGLGLPMMGAQGGQEEAVG